MFQTVAECVLFYYLTKKNENYKNIVRRNYRRRGRSQVFSVFKCSLCVVIVVKKRVKKKRRFWVDLHAILLLLLLSNLKFCCPSI